MEFKREKNELSLMQRIMNPVALPEVDAPVVVNSTAILEWLEEQAKESVRGRIHDKPRWFE